MKTLIIILTVIALSFSFNSNAQSCTYSTYSKEDVKSLVHGIVSSTLTVPGILEEIGGTIVINTGEMEIMIHCNGETSVSDSPNISTSTNRSFIYRELLENQNRITTTTDKPFYFMGEKYEDIDNLIEPAYITESPVDSEEKIKMNHGNTFEFLGDKYKGIRDEKEEGSLPINHKTTSDMDQDQFLFLNDVYNQIHDEEFIPTI